MSTQLKDVTFGDKVLKEDANNSVGDVKASSITADSVTADSVTATTIEPTYITINGTTYSLSVSEYGLLQLSPA